MPISWSKIRSVGRSHHTGLCPTTSHPVRAASPQPDRIANLLQSESRRVRTATKVTGRVSLRIVSKGPPSRTISTNKRCSRRRATGIAKEHAKMPASEACELSRLKLATNGYSWLGPRPPTQKTLSTTTRPTKSAQSESWYAAKAVTVRTS